jgi:multiple sugar transport system permease protein
MASSAPLATRVRWREAAAGYLFTLPAVVLFLAFVAGPMVALGYLSFTDYDLVHPPEGAGLENFRRLLDDDRLRTTLGNTALFVVAAIVLMNGLGLLLASMLNRGLPGWLKLLLRSMYFFPSLVALTYISLIWQFMLNRDIGAVNYELGRIGLPAPNWLGGPNLAKFTVVTIDVWRNTGFAMLIYLAALQDVPHSLREAASLDGAGRWRTFWHVELPAISPSVLFNVVLTGIGAWQIFETVIVLTDGGPGDATRSVSMYIYELAFQSFDMGYAAAVSVVLFAIIISTTFLILSTQRRWVHYG